MQRLQRALRATIAELPSREKAAASNASFKGKLFTENTEKSCDEGVQKGVYL